MSLSNILERDYLDHFLSRVTKASQEPYHRTAEEGERRYIVPCRLIYRRPRLSVGRLGNKDTWSKDLVRRRQIRIAIMLQNPPALKKRQNDNTKEAWLSAQRPAVFQKVSFYPSLSAHIELQRFLLAWKMMLI